MRRLLELVYLMLPVYVGNMSPPFSKFLPGWNHPISVRWLGEHKTVLGFSFGVAGAIATAWMQSRIGCSWGILDYEKWFGIGLACGLGAMCGDSVKSFFKRRMNIAPGQPWIPADQLDFVIGGLIALAPFVSLSLMDVLIILLVSFLADLVVNRLAFRLRIRNTPW